MSTETLTGEFVAGGDAAVVADLAQQAAEPTELQYDVWAVADGPGKVRIVDLDEYSPIPRHRRANRVVTDARSFVEYVNRHKIDGTEIYAHTNSSSVVAVIDSHESAVGNPGLQKHQLRLALEKSKPWLAWEKADGHLFAQDEFADFLEDRYLDVREPAPALLIDIATTFQAKTNVDFNSGVRLDSGDVRLTFEEKTTAKAGQKGDIEIPKRIELVIRPYIGGPIYSIWASFRYRLRGGSVFLGFKLERPENILDAAFADIVAEIRDGATDKDGVQVHPGVGGVPIFNGKPS